VIIERDESDASVFLGSVHESIAIFVLAVFFPFKSLVVDEAIVEIVLVFAIICFVFIFNKDFRWEPDDDRCRNVSFQRPTGSHRTIEEEDMI
jgi:hypothetical protein